MLYNFNILAGIGISYAVDCGYTWLKKSLFTTSDNTANKMRNLVNQREKNAANAHTKPTTVT